MEPQHLSPSGLSTAPLILICVNDQSETTLSIPGLSSKVVPERGHECTTVSNAVFTVTWRSWVFLLIFLTEKRNTILFFVFYVSLWSFTWAHRLLTFNFYLTLEFVLQVWRENWLPWIYLFFKLVQMFPVFLCLVFLMHLHYCDYNIIYS